MTTEKLGVNPNETRSKIEFSFLNGNLVVLAAHPTIFYTWSKQTQEISQC